jgi:hypothetical protein
VDFCWLSGTIHNFRWPKGAIKPEWIWGNPNDPICQAGDTIGCGLLLTPENNLAIFFTANGILMGRPFCYGFASSTINFAGKQIPIKNPGTMLFPTTRVRGISVEANFGNDLAKPFKYDINTCPGLALQHASNSMCIVQHAQPLQQPVQCYPSKLSTTKRSPS